MRIYTAAEGKKSIKCVAYVAVFAAFLIIVITTLVLVITLLQSCMSSPHSSVLATSGSNTSVLSTQRSIPAISMKFNAEVSLNKKPNFGRYKFENSSIAFTSYMGTLQVGDVKVPAAIAPSSATKNTTVTVMTNLTALHLKVPGQITSGVARLRAYSKLRGKSSS